MDIVDMTNPPKDFTSLNKSKVHIAVSAEDYNFSVEQRLLVPYLDFDKWGLMNHEGQVVANAKYDTIRGNCLNTTDCLIVGKIYPFGFATKSGDVASYAKYKYGAVNYEGEEIIPLEYFALYQSNDLRYLIAQDTQYKWGVLSKQNEIIVPFGSYDELKKTGFRIK